jgi:hypothetical protein
MGRKVLKRDVEGTTGGRIVIMDSITSLAPDDAGAIVVSASHGGVSSAEFALAFPLKAVFFNDAGVGKDNAGIAALEMLQEKSVAAGTVSHSSARIGDAADMWNNGVISHVNRAARELGLTPGSSLRMMLMQIISH